jgi:hypothetical protein
VTTSQAITGGYSSSSTGYGVLLIGASDPLNFIQGDTGWNAYCSSY